MNLQGQRVAHCAEHRKIVMKLVNHHWVRMIGFKQLSQKKEQGMKRLSDPVKTPCRRRPIRPSAANDRHSPQSA